MLSVDHSNTDGPPLAVKCVRKFGSALGGEVMFACAYSLSHVEFEKTIGTAEVA